MRATVKDESGAVVFDTLGDDPVIVADDLAEEMVGLVEGLEPSGELSIPTLTTWTVVVSH